MRIVAGKHKNRNIIAPQGMNTRPTSDKTRESIFNIIAPYIYDSNVLDIFAGSGALAIEALSRGAKKITLIDSDTTAIKAIKDNITNINELDKAIIIEDDYKVINTLNEVYDIILLDPPYKLDVFDEIFNIINQKGLLSKYGVIVFESDINHVLKENYEGYKLKTYKYGIAHVSVLFKI